MYNFWEKMSWQSKTPGLETRGFCWIDGSFFNIAVIRLKGYSNRLSIENVFFALKPVVCFEQAFCLLKSFSLE